MRRFEQLLVVPVAFFAIFQVFLPFSSSGKAEEGFPSLIAGELVIIRGYMGKNIVLFIDGTWNQAGDGNPTNVCKLWRRTLANEGPEQLVHYIRGVGTSRGGNSDLPKWYLDANLPQENNSWLSRKARKYIGGGCGLGMTARIQEAYAFLTENYVHGDQIFLFGFSRGAFAVRSLAGFIDEVGLLLRDHIKDVKSAYLLYESKRKQDRAKLARKLRRVSGFPRPGKETETVLPVHMIGVWDTVGALGIFERQRSMPIFNTGYHNTRLPSNVSIARHALALHELRETFEPLLWDDCKPGQSLLQVWFAGAHADIGGGYPETALSDISLEWMVQEAMAAGLRVAQAPYSRWAPLSPAAVHCEIQKAFVLATPTIRTFVPAALANKANEADGHAVHQSVIDRLSIPPLPAYRFWEDSANLALAEIDDATPLLAIMLVFCGQGIIKPSSWDNDTEVRSLAPPPYLPSKFNAAGLAALRGVIESFETALPVLPVDLVRVIFLNAALRAEAGYESIHDLTTSVCERLMAAPDAVSRADAVRDSAALSDALQIACDRLPASACAHLRKDMDRLQVCESLTWPPLNIPAVHDAVGSACSSAGGGKL